MSVILVAEQDAHDARRIADALCSAGWVAEIVRDLEDVARRGVDREQHCLLLASAALPEAGGLLDAFSRRRGGPGSVAIVSSTLEATETSSYQADEKLVKPFSDADLHRTVRRLIADASGSRPEASRQLTSEDIFGDVLAEVEAEARRAAHARRRAHETSRAVDDVERRLDETLSGILPEKSRRGGTSDTSEPTSRPSAVGTQRPRGRLEQATTAEIDRLLDHTLSSLRLPAHADEPSADASASHDAQEEPGSEEENQTGSRMLDAAETRAGSSQKNEPEAVIFEPPSPLEPPETAATLSSESPLAEPEPARSLEALSEPVRAQAPGEAVSPQELETSGSRRLHKILLAAAILVAASIAAGAGYVAIKSQRQGGDGAPFTAAPQQIRSTSSDEAPSADGMHAVDAERSEPPVDLEQLVAEEVSRRREEIVKEFEAKKRRLEEELERAQQPDPTSTQEPPSQDNPEAPPGDSDDSGNRR